jgi:hypothetical protein
VHSPSSWPGLTRPSSGMRGRLGPRSSPGMTTEGVGGGARGPLRVSSQRKLGPMIQIAPGVVVGRWAPAFAGVTAGGAPADDVDAPCFACTPLRERVARTGGSVWWLHPHPALRATFSHRGRRVLTEGSAHVGISGWRQCVRRAGNGDSRFRGNDPVGGVVVWLAVLDGLDPATPPIPAGGTGRCRRRWSPRRNRLRNSSGSRPICGGRFRRSRVA